MPILKVAIGDAYVGYHIYFIAIRPYFKTYQGHLNIYGVINLWEEHFLYKFFEISLVF